MDGGPFFIHSSASLPKMDFSISAAEVRGVKRVLSARQNSSEAYLLAWKKQRLKPG